MSKITNSFNARKNLNIGEDKFIIYSLNHLEKQGLGKVSRLPNSIKFLLESLLRNENGIEVTTSDILNLSKWNAKDVANVELPFKPARVILQDFTGVPAVVDLAALRSATIRLGGNPLQINPQIP